MKHCYIDGIMNVLIETIFSVLIKNEIEMTKAAQLTLKITQELKDKKNNIPMIYQNSLFKVK